LLSRLGKYHAHRHFVSRHGRVPCHAFAVNLQYAWDFIRSRARDANSWPNRNTWSLGFHQR
jgi:hypothetical protein